MRPVLIMTKPLIPDSASPQEREWFTMLTDGFRTDAAGREGARRQTREHHDCACSRSDVKPAPAKRTLKLKREDYAKLADHLYKLCNDCADEGPAERANMDAMWKLIGGEHEDRPRDPNIFAQRIALAQALRVEAKEKP